MGSVSSPKILLQDLNFYHFCVHKRETEAGDTISMSIFILQASKEDAASWAVVTTLARKAQQWFSRQQGAAFVVLSQDS